jgi:hypothetical protein
MIQRPSIITNQNGLRNVLINASRFDGGRFPFGPFHNDLGLRFLKVAETAKSKKEDSIAGTRPRVGGDELLHRLAPADLVELTAVN